MTVRVEMNGVDLNSFWQIGGDGELGYFRVWEKEAYKSFKIFMKTKKLKKKQKVW